MMSRMASHGDKSAPSRAIVCLIFFSGFTPRATDAGPIRGEAERLSESFYVVDSKVSANRATARHIKAKKTTGRNARRMLFKNQIADTPILGIQLDRQLVDFGSEDKVVFAKPTHLVRPKFDR